LKPIKGLFFVSFADSPDQKCTIPEFLVKQLAINQYTNWNSDTTFINGMSYNSNPFYGEKQNHVFAPSSDD
jgi:hypothetical protein